MPETHPPKDMALPGLKNCNAARLLMGITNVCLDCLRYMTYREKFMHWSNNSILGITCHRRESTFLFLMIFCSCLSLRLYDLSLSITLLPRPRPTGDNPETDYWTPGSSLLYHSNAGIMGVSFVSLLGWFNLMWPLVYLNTERSFCLYAWGPWRKRICLASMAKNCYFAILIPSGFTKS